MGRIKILSFPGCPLVLLGVPLFLLGGPMVFPLVFPWCSFGFPLVLLGFPLFVLGFPMVSPVGVCLVLLDVRLCLLGRPWCSLVLFDVAWFSFEAVWFSRALGGFAWSYVPQQCAVYCTR